MEIYNHYKEYVEFILSIIVTMWLLWLPFDDTYKNYVNYGLKQGQMTPNIENKYDLKLILFCSSLFKDYKYIVISKT